MTEMFAIIAAVLAAVAVLPGTLGVLMFTNNIASTPEGAGFIYRHAYWVMLLAVVLMIFALYQAIVAGSYSLWLIGAFLGFAGVFVFGFFMHTKFLFKPVQKPTFITLDEAVKRYGPDEEVVGVIDGNNQPWAFVSRLARRPHIVYQPDGDAPFIMSHCILAHSSMSYAMDEKLRQPDITVTSALANNLVFYEKNNQCSIIQMQNRSRDGRLALKTIPTVTVSLGTWKKLYPESRVWVRSLEWRDVFYLKLLSRADVIDPASDVVVYPLQNPKDERLPMKSLVNGVEINGETGVYPNALFTGGTRRMVEDEVGGTPLLVVSACGGDYNQIFDRRLDGRVLTFSPSAEDDNFRDNETGSVWDPTGECLAGPSMGAQLQPVPHYNKMFWYVWSDYHPGSRIYSPA